MSKSLRTISAVVLLAVPSALAAAPASDMIFDETVAADLPVGTHLVYDYTKTVPEQPQAEADPETDMVTGFAEGAVEMTLVEGGDGGRGMAPVLTRDDRSRELPTMATEGGNPLVVVFLEQVTRSVAGLSGGSPFYIRNRMIEAFATDPETRVETVSVAGEEAEIRSLTLTPLAGDPNAQALRGLDELTMTFSYGDDIPGGIYGLEAQLLNTDGVPVYREAMRLERVEEAP